MSRVLNAQEKAPPRSFVSQSLDLAVPVFDVHSVLELGPALQQLGLEDAFSPEVCRTFLGEFLIPSILRLTSLV